MRTEFAMWIDYFLPTKDPRWSRPILSRSLYFSATPTDFLFCPLLTEDLSTMKLTIWHYWSVAGRACIYMILAFRTVSMARPLSSTDQTSPAYLFKRDSYIDKSCTEGDFGQAFNTARSEAAAMVRYWYLDPRSHLKLYRPQQELQSLTNLQAG